MVPTVHVKLLLPADGTVVRVPGLPPVYDYEYYPQEVSIILSRSH